jgi:tetratricopeptide (TPR) repeat protein
MLASPLGLSFARIPSFPLGFGLSKMKVKLSVLILVALLCALSSSAQTPPTAVAIRSHVERFSTPAVRAEKAEADATARLKTNPNDAEALNSRALARMRLNHYQDAYDDLRQALSLNPSNSNYQANLGYVQWKLGRANEAVEAERAALKLDDKNYTAHYQLGRFLLRIGDPKHLPEAASQFRQALEIDPRQYDVRFELIAVYRLLDDAPRAMAQLLLVQDARPSDPRVPYVRGLLAADRNDLKGAVNEFQEALKRDSTLGGAWQDLGLAYIKLNQWTEAAQAFGELSRQRGDSPEAAYLHALALYNAQEIGEAEKEIRRALRLNPGAADAYTLLGIILASRSGANSEASEALGQAVALDPANFDAVFNLGKVQYTGKDYGAAVKSLRTAVELRPKSAEARFLLGTTLEAAGDSAAALREYQDLVKLDPVSLYGQLGLGTLLLKQGKENEAISALQHAITIDSRNFEASWSLGRALMLSERYAEAAEVLQTAVSLQPQRPDAHYQLGQALTRLGRNEEARKEFAIVDKLNLEFRTNSPSKNPEKQ